MSHDPGGELPPITTAIDSAVFRRFRLDIEGAPMHRVLSPAAECAMQTVRTRYHGAPAKHLLHLGDRENANRVLIEATPQRSRGA